MAGGARHDRAKLSGPGRAQASRRPPPGACPGPCRWQSARCTAGTCSARGRAARHACGRTGSGAATGPGCPASPWDTRVPAENVPPRRSLAIFSESIRSWSASTTTSPRRWAGTVSVSNRWARGCRGLWTTCAAKGGSAHAANPTSGSPSAVRAKKGACQPSRVPSTMPNGTPTTDATANASISMLVAWPLRSAGNMSATIARARPQAAVPASRPSEKTR